MIFCELNEESNKFNSYSELISAAHVPRHPSATPRREMRLLRLYPSNVGPKLFLCFVPLSVPPKKERKKESGPHFPLSFLFLPSIANYDLQGLFLEPPSEREETRGGNGPIPPLAIDYFAT